MQKFSSMAYAKKWFNNRYLDNEVAYIKSRDQMVVLNTKSASSKLKINSGTNIAESHLVLILDDIIELEKKLMRQKKDVLVMEKTQIGDTQQITYWTKSLIQIGKLSCLLIEQMPHNKFSLREIVKTKDVRPVKYKPKDQYNTRVEFTSREMDIMYLLSNNFSTTEIGEFLFLSPSTIRSYITGCVKTKLETLGYLIPDRKTMISIYKSLGYANKIPNGIFKTLKQTAIICEL